MLTSSNSIENPRPKRSHKALATLEKTYYDPNALYEVSSGDKEFALALVKIFLDTIPANSAEMVKANEQLRKSGFPNKLPKKKLHS